MTTQNSPCLCAITNQEVEVEIKLRDAQDFSLVIKGDGTYVTLQETLRIKEFKLCAEASIVKNGSNFRKQEITSSHRSSKMSLT